MARVIDRLRPYGIFILYGLLLSGALVEIARPVDRLLTRYLPQ
jgi:hypothetical protein